jgi:hypothetical protein
MLSIDEELTAAEGAKAAIDTLTLSTTGALSTPTIIVLREAVRAATPMSILSSQGPLNEARYELVVALSDVIHGPPTQQKIDKAKGAIEHWINRLRTA